MGAWAGGCAHEPGVHGWVPSLWEVHQHPQGHSIPELGLAGRPVPTIPERQVLNGVSAEEGASLRDEQLQTGPRALRTALPCECPPEIEENHLFGCLS